MRIRDILQRKAHPVETIGSRESIRTAAAKMREKNVAALVVTECAVIQGILAEREIVHALAMHGTASALLKIRNAMPGRIVTAVADDTVKRALDLMARNHERHLLVMEDGAVAGVLGIDDLLTQRLVEPARDAAAGRQAAHGRRLP